MTCQAFIPSVISKKNIKNSYLLFHHQLKQADKRSTGNTGKVDGEDIKHNCISEIKY